MHETKKYKMLTKREGRMMSIRFNVPYIEVPPKNLCALLYEIDLYELLFPFISVAKELRCFTKGSKAAFMKVWFPPPLSNRYENVWGAGINRFHNGRDSILIVANSIDLNGETEFMGIPLEHPKGLVPMKTYFYGFEIKVLGRNALGIEAIMKMDACIKNVPQSLIHWGSGKFMVYLFNKILRYAGNIEKTKIGARLANKENQEFI